MDVFRLFPQHDVSCLHRLLYIDQPLIGRTTKEQIYLLLLLYKSSIHQNINSVKHFPGLIPLWKHLREDLFIEDVPGIAPD